jgi:hypothetical protein
MFSIFGTAVPEPTSVRGGYGCGLSSTLLPGVAGPFLIAAEHGRTLPSAMTAMIAGLTRACCNAWHPAGEKSKFFFADWMVEIITDSESPAFSIDATSALVSVALPRVGPVYPSREPLAVEIDGEVAFAPPASIPCCVKGESSGPRALVVEDGV